MPVVDVSFALTGNTIPVDHGYALYGAVSRIIPAFHALSETETDQIGIHPIRGRLIGNREMALLPGSRLSFRMPSERLIDILPLAGKTLALEANAITVGVPQANAIVPAATLISRLVLIKGYVEPEAFLGALRQRLDLFGIRGTCALVPRNRSRSFEGRCGTEESRSPFVRRTLRIKDRAIVGFAVTVSGLSAQESVLLQEHGLGGRRRMGCGIFVPAPK